MKNYQATCILILIILVFSIPFFLAVAQESVKPVYTLKGFHSGQYTGEGVDVEIVTGFKPKLVEITYGENGGRAWKCEIQADAETIVYWPKGAGGTAGAVVPEKIIDGITIINDGFIIGTSSYINTAGETYYFEVKG